MPFEPSLRSRVVALLLTTSLPACEAVLDAPDYRVNATAEVDNPLVLRYATGGQRCAPCLEAGACGTAFDRCAEDPDCFELASCQLERPSPASEADCVVRLDPTDDVRVTAHALGRCYAQCVSECGGGRDLDCVGAYSFPGVGLHSPIRVTQTLRFLLAPERPPAGLDVSFCRPGETCDDPIVTVTTGEDGAYSAEVPISTSPVSVAGFRGFRLVHGQDGMLFPHRLHSSRPLMVDHIEETGLADEELTREVLRVVTGEANLTVIALQVFDCRTVGAGGLFFEVDSGDIGVVYSHGTQQWGAGPTRESQEGAALAIGVEPGRYHEIRAVTADGEVVASDNLFIPGDALVVATLFPRELP
ncbi:MAG TPA: hypothetical protein VFZ53_17250 [Polyangiaceae bacterium]